MAAAITAASSTPPHTKRGALACQVTGFAATHAITMTVTTPDGRVYTLNGTTDGSGNYNFANAGSIPMERLGVWTYSVNDGTSTVVNTSRVWDG